MADKKPKEDKPVEYTALTGFSAEGKVTQAGEPCPKFTDKVVPKLVAMKRMAPSDSDEAKAVVALIKARDERAEKDRKAAEKAGKIPGI